MEVDKQPKGRGRGPAARAAAIRGESSTRLSPMIPEQMEKNTTTRRSGKINRGLPPSEDEGPGQRLVETDAIQGLTMQELQMVYKHREKEEEKAKKKMATAALTGWESRYPSLSNVWSDDLACNILKCFQSRMRTYLWKKVVWQLRVKEAIRVESKGQATWKRNVRWLNLLLSMEVASTWGHFGAMRQRLRSSDFTGKRSGADCNHSEG